MLEQVAVRVDGSSEHVEVACHWAGGTQTHPALVRPVRRFEHLRGSGQMLATIRKLRGQDCSAAAIAEQLNAAGWRLPKREAFDASIVERLVFRHGLGGGRPIWSSNVACEPGVEWIPHEAAKRTGVHRHSAYHWLQEGRLRGRVATRGEQRIWLVQMSADELDQVRAAALPPANKNRT